ncbi:MAG: DUF192 domain-containing protein [Haloferacaceae archaeon]
MNLRSLSAVVVSLAVLAIAALLVAQLGLIPAPSDSAYERTTVTVVDANGGQLATVDVRVADTWRKRYTGLSDTDSLAYGEGMLFVHDGAGTHTYVMREMDFPLDIVFAAPDGTITTIHHAPVPAETPGDSLRPYEGRGKYVLEVPRGYANQTGMAVGDRLRIAGKWGAGTR